MVFFPPWDSERLKNWLYSKHEWKLIFFPLSLAPPLFQARCVISSEMLRQSFLSIFWPLAKNVTKHATRLPPPLVLVVVTTILDLTIGKTSPFSSPYANIWRAGVELISLLPLFSAFFNAGFTFYVAMRDRKRCYILTWILLQEKGWVHVLICDERKRFHSCPFNEKREREKGS